MLLTFDSEGGTLKGPELLKYSDTVNDTQLMQVFEENAKRVYLGQTGLIGGNYPNHKTPMTVVPGAREFLDEMRTRFQVIVLSDTFYEFADPLMRQLGRPTLFCHRLVVDADGRVRARSEVTGAAADPQFLTQVKALLAGP